MFYQRFRIPFHLSIGFPKTKHNVSYTLQNRSSGATANIRSILYYLRFIRFRYCPSGANFILYLLSHESTNFMYFPTILRGLYVEQVLVGMTQFRYLLLYL